MSTSFFHVPVTVDKEDYEETVRDLLSEAKPTWDRKNIDIEKNTKGFTNTLLVCHEKSESESCNSSTECDKIIVRVFGGNYGEMARQQEIEIMKIVSDNGIIPKVYGSFQNGVVYGYAPGVVLTRDEISNQKILTFKDHFGSLEHLEKLKSSATAIYEELVVSYPPVFCHLDGHHHNIVYDIKTDKITLIDWDDCQMAPEVIAILIDRNADFINYDDALDNPEARRPWVRTYLSTHPQYKSEPITDELFQQWYRDSLKASMVSTLIVGMWGLFSVFHPPRDFDFFLIVKHQMDRFYRYRNELADMENK